ncbi:hypothetical protein QJS10_CPB18g00350 [Acorus calamus]|uniref:Uncharacterized protein n=1 Tax=Acorus calamus TaxID=4465 RepID=A0AAV9CPT8_ACOCL|nr:hypothetical protein QJS10_CPB18g00350 [Acorus calamus]
MKAAEFGYTGVTYNHPIKGFISAAGRCSISLFTLSSLLKASPTLSATVRFHRSSSESPLISDNPHLK